MTQVCCGTTVRISGNEYRCNGCDAEVTSAFRKAGLAGEVIHWLLDDKQVIVRGRVTHISYMSKEGRIVEALP